MESFINQITAYQLFVIVVFIYFLINSMLAKKYVVSSANESHPIDVFIAFLVFFLFGSPLIIYNSLKNPNA